MLIELEIKMINNYYLIAFSKKEKVTNSTRNSTQKKRLKSFQTFETQI